MSEENIEVPVAELYYEQAREQLVAAIAQLESGKLGLEESLKVWAVSYTHLTLPTSDLV